MFSSGSGCSLLKSPEAATEDWGLSMMAAGETGLVGRTKKLVQEEAIVPAPGRSQWGWLSSDHHGFTSFRDDSSHVLGSPSFSENPAGWREH